MSSRKQAAARCPGCGRARESAPTQRYAPFCSERCKTNDLAAWLGERYRVAQPPRGDDAGAPRASEP